MMLWEGNPMLLRCFLALAVLLLHAPAVRAAPITITGFTFSSGEEAFADDASVTSGSVTGADAAALHTVLVGSNTEDSIRASPPTSQKSRSVL